MCQTPGAGMQHDGDLGAIVRSAGASISSPGSDPVLEPSSSAPNSSPPKLRSSPLESSSLIPGSFMELISGGAPMESLSSFPAQTFELPPHRLLDHQIKCEPLEPGPDFDQIFSQSRGSLASFMDVHHNLFAPRSGGGAAAAAAESLQVKSELDLTTNSSFDCGSPSSAASPGGSAAKAENDPSNSLNANTSSNPGSGSGKHQSSKRSRKMQQKRIVCVPVAGGGKPSGEVLPSDMWAWRKYGQKPIKGSPYPRGYYRCSSSKGCSARKQVERCRNDPTMLIITYTSEHNHPWPAHRNSLAGTTRIRPMTAANATAASNSSSATAGSGSNSSEDHVIKLAETAGAQQAAAQIHHSELNPEQNPFVSIVNTDPMQVDHKHQGLNHHHHHHQELHHQQQHHLQQQQFHGSLLHHQQFVLADIGGSRSISSSQEEDFFSELEELPELSSILEKGFLRQFKSEEAGGSSAGNSGAESSGGNSGAARASVDPFNLFSWSSDSAPKPSSSKQEHKQ